MKHSHMQEIRSLYFNWFDRIRLFTVSCVGFEVFSDVLLFDEFALMKWSSSNDLEWLSQRIYE